MYLTVDAGNTNVVLNGYEGESSLFCERVATDRTWTADQYAAAFRAAMTRHGAEKAEGAIVSSVVPAITEALLRAAEQLTGRPALLFGMNLPTGVPIRSDHPWEVGNDLLAGAAGVAAHHLPMPAVIIDMGTATKLTAMTAEGAILGVSIAPGLRLGLNALLNGTSLPDGDVLVACENAIGTDTIGSLRSGLVLGHAAMLDGLLDRFDAELGGCATIVATGGLAWRVVPLCKRKMPLLPNLIPDGLAATYRAVQAQK